jgi:serine/threonine protein kinase
LFFLLTHFYPPPQKPSNFLVDLDGSTVKRVAVTDFGLVQSDSPENGSRAGQEVLGCTPGWVSPEVQENLARFATNQRQIRFDPMRADMFAIGLVIHFVITGQSFSPNAFVRVKWSLDELLQTGKPPDLIFPARGGKAAWEPIFADLKEVLTVRNGLIKYSPPERMTADSALRILMSAPPSEDSSVAPTALQAGERAVLTRSAPLLPTGSGDSAAATAAVHQEKVERNKAIEVELVDLDAKKAAAIADEDYVAAEDAKQQAEALRKEMTPQLDSSPSPAGDAIEDQLIRVEAQMAAAIAVEDYAAAQHAKQQADVLRKDVSPRRGGPASPVPGSPGPSRVIRPREEKLAECAEWFASVGLGDLLEATPVLRKFDLETLHRRTVADLVRITGDATTAQRVFDALQS